jgi:hypothetical protein
MCGCVGDGWMGPVVAGEDGKVRGGAKGDRCFTLNFLGHVWEVQGWCDNIM